MKTFVSIHSLYSNFLVLAPFAHLHSFTVGCHNIIENLYPCGLANGACASASRRQLQKCFPPMRFACHFNLPFKSIWLIFYLNQFICIIYTGDTNSKSKISPISPCKMSHNRNSEATSLFVFGRISLHEMANNNAREVFRPPFSLFRW